MSTRYGTSDSPPSLLPYQHPETTSINATRQRQSVSLSHFKAELFRVLKNHKRILLVFLLVTCSVFLFYSHRDDVVSVHMRDLGYATRPLWEKAPERFKNVIHFSNDEFLWRGLGDGAPPSTVVSSDADGYSRVCKAHALQGLPEHQAPPKVYDVVIFSVELDLLEIRIRELYNVVDYFVILESNVTFSGDHKPLTFQDNQAQFEFAKDKIVHGNIGNLKLASAPTSAPSSRKAIEEMKKEDPFKNEIKMRVGVSHFIDSLKPAKGDIILQSDVDEIPSSRAVSLLKHCIGYSNIIHLGMPSYLYSFEFPMERKNVNPMNVNNGEGAGPRQWRASAKRYGTRAYNGYTHSRQSETILEKAGWHLTFAFRYIEDFIFKMKSYSHNDRVTSPDILSPATIQDKICKGADIYDMLPEAYDFKSLLDQWGRIPSSKDVRNIPKSVLEHEDRFRYLLPGGCKREFKKSS